MSASTDDLIRGEMKVYADHLQHEGLGKHTVRAYVSDVRLMMDDYAEIDPDEFLQFENQWLYLRAVNYLNRSKGEVAASSLNRRASAIRKYFETCRGGCAPILKDWKGATPAPGEAHPLPGLMADVRLMIACEPNPEVKCAIGMMGFAGLRVSECRQVTPASLVSLGWIEVHGKGTKDRKVPLTNELEDLLTAEAASRPRMLPTDRFIKMSDSGIRNAVTRAGVTAGIARPVATHDLRMTFGTVVYQSTHDLRTTQQLLGHASSVTTERYTGITETNKIEAVKAAMAQ